MNLNLDSINQNLMLLLDTNFSTPESGIDVIQQELSKAGFDLSSLDIVDYEGDEMIIDLNDEVSLYIVYYLTDDDEYEFFAELGDESRMDELISDEEDEEEE